MSWYARIAAEWARGKCQSTNGRPKSSPAKISSWSAKSPYRRTESPYSVGDAALVALEGRGLMKALEAVHKGLVCARRQRHCNFKESP